MVELKYQLEFSEIYNKFLINSYSFKDISVFIGDIRYNCIGNGNLTCSSESIQTLLYIPKALLDMVYITNLRYGELINELDFMRYKKQSRNYHNEKLSDGKDPIDPCLTKYKKIFDSCDHGIDILADFMGDIIKTISNSGYDIDSPIRIIESFFAYYEIINSNLTPEKRAAYIERFNSYGVIFARTMEKAFNC